MQNDIYHICIYQYAKTQSLTSLLKTVFLHDRQDKQSQMMREYNPTIQYANKEDHPTMAMNNILACPWQPILGNEEPSVKTCFLAKLLEVLLQILHFPKNGLSGAIRIALFSLWEEVEAKLLRPGQLLGYAWNFWDITLQMSYVEGRWPQNWDRSKPTDYFTRVTQKLVKICIFL